MADRIRNRVAIVTGASSGIGASVARMLARRGAHVVLASRNRAALEALARELQQAGGAVAQEVTDVTRPADVEQLVRRTLERFGRVDIAVCNAGEYLRRPVRELRIADIEHMMAVNFYGTVRLVEAVLPGMLERRAGHIVAVTSVDGKKGLPPDGAYVASKFAATGYMDVLRQELRGTGVFATTILPGRVDTPMIAHVCVPLISAKISPDVVARAVVRGVQQRRREIIVPFAGPKLLVVAAGFSAGVSDAFVRLFRLEGKDMMKENKNS